MSISHALSLRERRVLLADFDPQGQCAISLAVNPEPGVFNVHVNPRSDIHQWIRETGRAGLDLIPGDRSTATAQIVINAENRPINSIRQIFRELSREYDYLVFDTAPSVGGIQELAVFAADLVLIPTATEFLSIDGLAQMMEMLTALRGNSHWDGKLLGILPTFYDEQTSESGRSLSELRESFGDGILSPIHRATINDSRSAKCWNTVRNDTPARSETCLAVGRRFHSPMRARIALTTVLCVRAARALLPSTAAVLVDTARGYTSCTESEEKWRISKTNFGDPPYHRETMTWSGRSWLPVRCR